MMTERWLWDRFLFQIRESGLIPEGGKILDVGTGINTTTLEMFSDKWDVTPSDVNVGEWNSHIPGMIELDVEFLGNDKYESQWDGIIMSEILEHIPPTNIPDVIEGCHKALKDKGILVISMPFMYRIHEYGPDDPETVEPSLRDYSRITPSGMLDYLERSRFKQYWVGRLVKDDIKTFPQYYCPEGVVAWAQKFPEPTEGMGYYAQAVIDEGGWNPSLPVDWRARQQYMASEYAERVERKEEEIE